MKGNCKLKKQSAVHVDTHTEYSILKTFSNEILFGRKWGSDAVQAPLGIIKMLTLS